MQWVGLSIVDLGQFEKLGHENLTVHPVYVREVETGLTLAITILHETA